MKKRSSHLEGKGNGIASKIQEQKENGGESEERQKERRKTKNGEGRRTNIHIVPHVIWLALVYPQKKREHITLFNDKRCDK